MASLALFLICLCGARNNASAAEQASGEQLYRRQCAKCHGAAGEGVKNEYDKPLLGDRSVAELAKLIEKTMPEDAPGDCVGEDARRVAEYMHAAFYSPVAQARNQPARIELARLTVRQYRHAVADLMGGFRPGAGAWDDKRGLQAEYFKSQRMQKSERVIERVDPVVAFDFGEESPDAAQIKPAEFSTRWQGGLLAMETGQYEFIVSCENGARLWINDLDRPLIDGAVKSGSDRERRESLWLLGGRVYPLRLEFFKSQKAKEKRASISLKWKPPHRVDEVIPATNLSPNRFVPVCVVQTPFPPDDRSVGYERGTSISKAWEQAATDAALEVADYVAGHLRELSGAANDAPDRPQRLKKFCQRWAELAMRRPLSEDEKTFFVERQFQQAADLDVAVKRVVLLTLMSPRFLYHEIDGEQQTSAAADAYDVACRLSFGLWDSLPDAELLKAAAGGKLKTPEQVRGQAELMIGDVRTRGKLHEFFLQWTKVEQFSDLAKDSQRFPEFDEQIVSDLRTALDLFLEDVVWGESSDFRSLLLADWLYLNGRLATFYNVELPDDAPFQKVALSTGERAGVLTHPLLMAGFAYTGTSSPIHRGVFVARSVLGRSLRPPPEAVAPLPAEIHADLTTRERVSLQTKGQSCQACHQMINPLGFAFENFDAVGRYRDDEQGRAINATGSYQTRAGDEVGFGNVRDLASFLANSPETHAALVEQLFHHLVKQPIRAFGPDQLPKLQESFTANEYNLRKLVVEIAVASALRRPAGGQLSASLRAEK
jgi:mono/diheme cytochrome c family protein